ncbi:molybdate transport system ATP-binding protein [Anseongella ginsenosidimutans]|uniref:Molybdate transport system ATP-binding protein n=1 Tax=Anseongella ginsenosidimutans TaxID=496056 RepID=A0A4R3KST2_9SPHI|nr:ATP-binding cassette domain-containing protein [Anseongella ginsenosidimutans]TCS86791.1 molybdate transport system ATP-binding protein [Anseongella ginsenosidimutans]
MIELDVSKKLRSPYGEMLLRVQAEIESERLVVLYGKSGAGKTSLLRMLAGLLRPDSGRIIVNGFPWLNTSKKINLPARKRKTGFVFQEPSLFPNMTVKENLAFALNRGQDKKIIDELIGITELGQLENCRPQKLSGGQKQRVALARALVCKPDLLLLDEPFSALDSETREKLQAYILQVHQQYHLSTIIVSHDTAEILKIADEVIVLDNGKVTRQDPPSAVFTPRNLNGNPCPCPFVLSL